MLMMEVNEHMVEVPRKRKDNESKRAYKNYLERHYKKNVPFKGNEDKEMLKKLYNVAVKKETKELYRLTKRYYSNFEFLNKTVNIYDCYDENEDFEYLNENETVLEKIEVDENDNDFSETEEDETTETVEEEVVEEVREEVDENDNDFFETEEDEKTETVDEEEVEEVSEEVDENDNDFFETEEDETEETKTTIEVKEEETKTFWGSVKGFFASLFGKKETNKEEKEETPEEVITKSTEENSKPFINVSKEISKENITIEDITILKEGIQEDYNRRVELVRNLYLFDLKLLENKEAQVKLVKEHHELVEQQQEVSKHLKLSF